MTRLHLLLAALVATTVHTALGAALDELQPRAGCAANNCARAVTGTAVLPGKPDVTSRQKDCSTFMATTAILYGEGMTLSLRSVTVVPSYATACTSGSPRSAYASACSCWGITATIIETPGPEAPQCFSPNFKCGDTCCNSEFQACSAGVCVCRPDLGFQPVPPVPVSGGPTGCLCAAGLVKKPPPQLGCTSP